MGIFKKARTKNISIEHFSDRLRKKITWGYTNTCNNRRNYFTYFEQIN